jgi:stress-induced-phosphoprotein 1
MTDHHMNLSSLKDLGNAEFKAKNFEKAIEIYTDALNETPTDHTILGNRAMAYSNLQKFEEMLKDAEKCIEIKPDWGKGYHRKGAALHKLGKFEESAEAYSKGLSIDPKNASMSAGFHELRNEWQSKTGDKQAPEDLLTSEEAVDKLKADPRTAAYFNDPQFVGLWAMFKSDMIKENPAMMMQMFQSDSRLMMCF